MNARRFLRLLLAVLVTAGLTVAPLVTPAAAEHSMLVPMQMVDTQAMPDDMACCPDTQNSKQCQDCPLVAICMLKVLQNEPTTNGLGLRPVGSRTLRPGDEPLIAGLTRPPPDQPPRTLV